MSAKNLLDRICEMRIGMTMSKLRSRIANNRPVYREEWEAIQTDASLLSAYFEAYEDLDVTKELDLPNLCAAVYLGILAPGKDGKINTPGGVNFDNKSLGAIPFDFGVVGQDFDCSSNHLDSLHGAPEECPSFICKHNSLTSLIGGPSIVHGNYICYGCHLKTLEGAPEEVGGRFDCSYNHLKSLAGIPKIIHGDFCYTDWGKVTDWDTDRYKPTEDEVRSLSKIGGKVHFER